MNVQQLIQVLQGLNPTSAIHVLSADMSFTLDIANVIVVSNDEARIQVNAR